MSAAVLTGVGVVSAFGVGARAFFQGLAEGRAAVGPIRSFDARPFPVRVAGEVPAPPVIDGVRDRKVAFGVEAAREAWRAAGCGEAERGAALVVAVGLEQALLQDFAPLMRDGGIDWNAPPAPSSSSSSSSCAPLFRAPIDQAVRVLADRMALRGPVVAHVSACAAGTLAVTHAAALIERGEIDVALAGAFDSMVNPLGLGGMTRLGAPSPRNQPDACRPFDRRRDGLAIGEGAAMFVVERAERARARGAPALARILGWGSTQDGYRVTMPRPDGRQAARAMSLALARARLPPEAIGYINAHGTGTPLNDPAEARAIHLALGAHGARVPVSSIKGAVGHLMAASGAIEIAACLLPFSHGLLPGTAHHQEPDPDCALNVIGPSPVARDVQVVLSNSFGFGGQNATVLLGRGDVTA
jgi:3-oxoacyl-[acyl-carrier-protein] synthase II